MNRVSEHRATRTSRRSTRRRRASRNPPARGADRRRSSAPTRAAFDQRSVRRDVRHVDAAAERGVGVVQLCDPGAGLRWADRWRADNEPASLHRLQAELEGGDRPGHREVGEGVRDADREHHAVFVSSSKARRALQWHSNDDVLGRLAPDAERVDGQGDTRSTAGSSPPPDRPNPAPSGRRPRRRTSRRRRRS